MQAAFVTVPARTSGSAPGSSATRPTITYPDGRSIQAFEFRAMRPTFDIGAFHLHAAPGDSPDVLQAWSSDNLGRVGVQGRVTLST